MALNTVDSVEAFSTEIMQGNWDAVLKTVSQLKISDKKLMDLYEQVNPLNATTRSLVEEYHGSYFFF